MFLTREQYIMISVVFSREDEVSKLIFKKEYIEEEHL